MKTTTTAQTAHTPEPWTEDGSRIYRQVNAGGHKTYIAGTLGDLPISQRAANIPRIVACVNACAGLPDPAIVPELVEALLEAETHINWAFQHACNDNNDQEQIDTLDAALVNINAILDRCGKATP